MVQKKLKYVRKKVRDYSTISHSKTVALRKVIVVSSLILLNSALEDCVKEYNRIAGMNYKIGPDGELEPRPLHTKCSALEHATPRLKTKSSKSTC